jgi:hypothetical protein
MLEKNGSVMVQYISYSFTREVLYNILIEFWNTQEISWAN